MMVKMKKKIVGEKFINTHSGQEIIVESMIWFNIKYKFVDYPEYGSCYMHYETFMKYFQPIF